MTVDLYRVYRCTCSFRRPWPWCKVIGGRQMQKVSVESFWQLSKQQTLNLLQRLVISLRDLDFTNVYMACPICFCVCFFPRSLGRLTDKSCWFPPHGLASASFSPAKVEEIAKSREGEGEMHYKLYMVTPTWRNVLCFSFPKICHIFWGQITEVCTAWSVSA